MLASAINNTTAFSVYTNYAKSSLSLNRSTTKITEGVNRVWDDGAAVGISERFRSQAKSTDMARCNVESSISMMQTADSWMQQISNMLSRMHELVIEGQDASKTTTDLSNVQAEFKELQKQITMIGDSNAKFNGMAIFSSNFAGGIDTQMGADMGQTITLTTSDLRSNSGVSIGGATWASINSAQFTVSHSNAIGKLQSAIDYISKERAGLGGQLSRLRHTRGGLLSYETNIRSAESKYRDVDMAKETSEMTKFQILSQVGNAMLAQANQLPSSLVDLLK
jgi:flagellin